MVDDQTAANIVHLLTLIFNTQKKVTENGLIALSGLINGVGNRLKIESFGQYVVYALQSSEDECVRLGCGIVSDLANAFNEQITGFLTDFVAPLAKILQNPQSSRKAKVSALLALGDLAMNAGPSFNKVYLVDTLKILNSASQQSLVRVEEQQDPDLYGYL